MNHESNPVSDQAGPHAADAVPSHLRKTAAGHEAAHAVIGLLAGIRVVRATIDLTVDERVRYGVSALVDHAPRPDDWPITLSPFAYVDFAAAGYAWELHAGTEAGAWERCARDRGLVINDDVFTEAAEAVRARFTPPVVAAIEAVAARLVAGADLDGDDLLAIVSAHGLLPAQLRRA